MKNVNVRATFCAAALFFTVHVAHADPDAWADACSYPDPVDSTLTPQVSNLLKAEVLLLDDRLGQIVDRGNGTWELLSTGSLASDWNGHAPLCPYSLFDSTQYRAATAGRSGFLIAPDKVVTAPHSITGPNLPNFDPSHWVVVYGINRGLLNQSCNLSNPVLIPSSNVYRWSGGFYVNTMDSDFYSDFAVFQLDRPVTGATSLRLRSSGVPSADDVLAKVGHPVGLLAKFQYGIEYEGPLGGNTGGNDPLLPTFLNYFSATGESGTPFYNLTKGVVESVASDGGLGTFTAFDPINQCWDWKSQYDDTMRPPNMPPPVRSTMNAGRVETLAAVAQTTELRVAPLQDTTYKLNLGQTLSPTSTSYTLTASPYGGQVFVVAGADPAPSGQPQLLSSPDGGWFGYLDPTNNTRTESVVASVPSGVPCGTYDRYFEVDANGVSDFVRHRFEIGLKEFALTPPDGWMANDIGSPYVQSKTYTLHNPRGTPTHVVVSRDTTLPNSNLVLINGGASVGIDLGVSGSGTDTATFTLTIDPAVAGGTTVGVQYEGGITVSNNPITCSVESETVPTTRAVSFKKSEQLFRSAPEIAIISPPSSLRFDFDLSGEALSECVKDLNLYLGVPPPVQSVDDIASHIQISLTAPSGLQRVLWQNNTPSGPNYHADVSTINGTIIPALYLDDQSALPLGPYLLSAFNNQLMKGHWYMDVSATNGYRIGPAQLYFTKAPLCH